MKIRGNTVGTPMAKPDWNETNPNRAGYIFNKPGETDLNMGGHSITNVGSLQSQSIDVKDLFVIGEDGETGAGLSPEGYEDGYAVLTFYGIEGDEYTRLRYVAPGKLEYDAVNLGQLNNAVGNIETALDSILSIQEQLIGGADE